MLRQEEQLVTLYKQAMKTCLPQHMFSFATILAYLSSLYSCALMSIGPIPILHCLFFTPWILPRAQESVNVEARSKAIPVPKAKAAAGNPKAKAKVKAKAKAAANKGDEASPKAAPKRRGR